MVRHRVCPLAVAAVVVLTVGGCGGGGGPDRRTDVAHVKQVVRRALADLAAGDGAGFCALSTPAGRAELGRALPGATCAELVARVSRQLPAVVRTGLAHAEIRKVTIAGGRAAVADADIVATRGTLTGFLSAQRTPTTLTRQSDGSWKIAG